MCAKEIQGIGFLLGRLAGGHVDHFRLDPKDLASLEALAAVDHFIAELPDRNQLSAHPDVLDERGKLRA